MQASHHAAHGCQHDQFRSDVRLRCRCAVAAAHRGGHRNLSARGQWCGAHAAAHARRSARAASRGATGAPTAARRRPAAARARLSRGADARCADSALLAFAHGSAVHAGARPVVDDATARRRAHRDRRPARLVGAARGQAARAAGGVGLSHQLSFLQPALWLGLAARRHRWLPARLSQPHADDDGAYAGVAARAGGAGFREPARGCACRYRAPEPAQAQSVATQPVGRAR